MQDEATSLLGEEEKSEACGTADTVEFTEASRGDIATSCAAVLPENAEQSQPDDGERGNRPNEQPDPESANHVSDHSRSISSVRVEGDLIMGVRRKTVEELMKAWSKVLIQSLQSQGRAGRSDGFDVELGLRNPREAPFDSSESNVDILYHGIFPNAGCSSNKEENDRALAKFRRIPQENGRYVKRPVFGAFNNYGYPNGQTPWLGEPVQVMSLEEVEKEDAEWELKQYGPTETWHLTGRRQKSNGRPNCLSGSATEVLLSLLYPNAEETSRYGHCHVNLIHSSVQVPIVDVSLNDIFKNYLERLGTRKRALILVEHLKEQEQHPLATLLKRCYARGILDQTLELPRRMFGWRIHDNPVFSNDSSIRLTQPQTHALNAWVIVEILRALDIWDIYPTKDDCFGGIRSNEIREIYCGHPRTHARAQDIIRCLYTTLEESAGGFRNARDFAAGQQLSHDELKESSFTIGNLGITSLHSLGKIKIRFSWDHGGKWLEKDDIWNEVMQTWRILFAFDNGDIIESEAFLSAYNAIKPPWFPYRKSSNGVPRADRATLRLVTDWKAVRDFWTFWLVVIFGAISVFLAVASLAVSSAQAWAAFHPPGG
ncbi:hypothetical protein HYALB_00004677 [Hymenoscyphus albidus]|uniref:Transmembrane protein n=1 Tax=Hymenoscyphus albidus TaxID=595503 RepID=A0A9N9LP08_9HELO|nr:hypothetical protein HYALB_00004677 [Hymenoscyphus albidus]